MRLAIAYGVLGTFGLVVSRQSTVAEQRRNVYTRDMKVVQLTATAAAFFVLGFVRCPAMRTKSLFLGDIRRDMMTPYRI